MDWSIENVNQKGYTYLNFYIFDFSTYQTFVQVCFCASLLLCCCPSNSPWIVWRVIEVVDPQYVTVMLTLILPSFYQLCVLKLLISYLCYSTVTCRVLDWMNPTSLNQPQRKLGQSCANSNYIMCTMNPNTRKELPWMVTLKKKISCCFSSD